MKVGVKSTALRFGDSTKEWITGFGIACISSLALSGFNAGIGIYLLFVLRVYDDFFSELFFNLCYGTGWPYYAFLAAASGHLGWQMWTVDLSSRADCNRKCVFRPKESCISTIKLLCFCSADTNTSFPFYLWVTLRKYTITTILNFFARVEIACWYWCHCCSKYMVVRLLLVYMMFSRMTVVNVMYDDVCKLLSASVFHIFSCFFFF